MNKIIAGIAAAALTITAGAAAILIPSAPAQAQTVVWTCTANSPSASGWGTGYSLDSACQTAMYQCSIRTPTYQTCYVTRYWYNY